MNWTEIINILWSEKWDLFLMIGAILYRRPLYTALAGGNGVLQIEEVAKGILLIVFYLSFIAESNRDDLSNAIFPESYWYAIIGGVFMIGGLKVLDKIKDKTEQ